MHEEYVPLVWSLGKSVAWFERHGLVLLLAVGISTVIFFVIIYPAWWLYSRRSVTCEREGCTSSVPARAAIQGRYIEERGIWRPLNQDDPGVLWEDCAVAYFCSLKCRNSYEECSLRHRTQ